MPTMFLLTMMQMVAATLACCCQVVAADIDVVDDDDDAYVDNGVAAADGNDCDAVDDALEWRRKC